MKTRYEYIHFDLLPQPKGRKTSMWLCMNNRTGGVLGEVRWYSTWRQYCFMPTTSIVLSAGCMADIQTFIGALRTGVTA